MGNPPKGKASVKSAGSTPSPEHKKPTARESSPHVMAPETSSSRVPRSTHTIRVKRTARSTDSPRASTPPASFPRTRSPRVHALTLPCSYNAVGRKKIRIERIADERNRQVTKRPL